MIVRMRRMGHTDVHIDEAGQPLVGVPILHRLTNHSFTPTAHIWPRTIIGYTGDDGIVRDPVWAPGPGEAEADRPRGVLGWCSEDGEIEARWDIIGPKGGFSARLPYAPEPISYAALRVLGIDQTDERYPTLIAILEAEIDERVSPYTTAAATATAAAGAAAANADAAAGGVAAVVAEAQADVSAAVASASTATATALSSAAYATDQGEFALAAAQGTDTMVFTLDQMPDVPLPGRRIVVHAYGRTFWYHGGGIWRDPFGEVLDTFLIPISLGVAQFSRNSEGMFTPEPGA
jgi:hypothetical protein